MAYDSYLADLMRTALEEQPGISEKKMFGGICWLMNGNMLCGTREERYMFRVGKEQQDEALKKPGADLMSLSGRKMGGIIWVSADECIDETLEEWVAMAANFAGSLPPK